MENNNFIPEPQDIAMDVFRSLFQTPLITCHVAANGRIMRYRIIRETLCDRYLSQARRIIKENDLPLEAKIVEWRTGAVVFDRWLQLEFVGVKTLLPCY